MRAEGLPAFPLPPALFMLIEQAAARTLVFNGQRSKWCLIYLEREKMPYCSFDGGQVDSSLFFKTPLRPSSGPNNPTRDHVSG